MNVAQIREKFLQFFATHGHTIVPSSSLIPDNDPTLLFTNSGMVQFKDVFLGTVKRPYIRATSAQRCLRAGGKHNDLENVGYTARHHTFFEMLGNFSLGDYFKRDAIRYAWQLLTEVYGLPKERLWVTVYQEDDEAFTIWQHEIGVPIERIVRIGDNKGARYASDNFWQMADTGPCGPCSEIFYDHGPTVPGGPPGSAEQDGDRYIEIWNLVFMQFNRDEHGTLTPLPKPCVDTGMGLERIAAILQGVHSNYEIDLFQTLIAASARVTQQADRHHASLRVIADHIRACAFLVCDGVIPGNEGRGYVLRRIIRRAIRHGYQLGRRAPFFYCLVDDLCREMGAAYPSLLTQQAHIANILQTEEIRFFETIEYGMNLLGDELEKVRQVGRSTLDGGLAFKLHDTYGFPLDLTQDICREQNMLVDVAMFDLAMARQREQARASGKFKAHTALSYSGVHTVFQGYEQLTVPDVAVCALYVDGVSVEQLHAGQSGVVVLDKTPFYAESGGQVGDSGELRQDECVFLVQDTQKIQSEVFGHIGVLAQGTLKIGDRLHAQVDLSRRNSTMRNHSATHLLHKALRQILGVHVQQKGSLVDPDKTRFDFSHHLPVTSEQLLAIETEVNREILENSAIQSHLMGFDEAVKHGAMALFGEKYSDTVRVLDIGSSRELCGGTHVQRTGDIGLFKIIAESGVAAGIRRIEAITGQKALSYTQTLTAQMQLISESLKTNADEIVPRIELLQAQLRALEKTNDSLQAKLVASQLGQLSATALEISGIKVIAAELVDSDTKNLRVAVDQLKKQLDSAVIVLASIQNDKASLVIGVTANLSAQMSAGELANFVAQQIGGKGGGKPDMAQAGGAILQKLPQALSSVSEWVQTKVKKHAEA